MSSQPHPLLRVCRQFFLTLPYSSAHLIPELTTSAGGETFSAAESPPNLLEARKLIIESLDGSSRMSATTGLPTNFAVHFAEEEAEPMEPVGRSLLDEETDGAIDFTTERRVSHDQKQLTKKLSSVSMLVRQKISMSVYLSDGNPIEVACLDTDEAEEIIERTLATYHAMVKKGEKKDLGIEDDPAAFKLFMHAWILQREPS